MSTEWKYLESPAFFARQMIAAGNLRDMDLIIELGAYKTSLRPFADCPVVCIDERLKNSTHFQDIGENFPASRLNVPESKDVGVVMLGMDMRLDAAGKQALYDLLNKAKRVVIEFPPAHKPSVTQLQDVLSNTNKKVTQEIGLDLTNNDFGDLSGSAPVMANRRVYILE
jgi:hypothetical protein